MTNMKTKKNEKTYAVAKDTLFFLTKLRRFMHSAWLQEEYPCYRDEEFTKKMADFFEEKGKNLLAGVVLERYDKHRFFILNLVTRLEWWPWLQTMIYSRGIFGIGAALRRDIYEGYQEICRYFDGMFTEENKRDIMDIGLTGYDMSVFNAGWFLLKKYAD